MPADPALTDATVTTVTVVDRRTSMRGAGVVTLTGADRDAVHALAIERFNELQRQWRGPSDPATYRLPDGRWQASIAYWSCE